MTDATKPNVLDTVANLTSLALKTYAVNPARVEEDANSERRIHQGGYGDRQLFELIQNAADELREQPFQGGRVEAILTTSCLYCANEGTPITPEGAETILRMGVSRKRGGQIGRFGVGVKSVLSVSRTPQFFSTSGSFGFDAEWSAREIRRTVLDEFGQRANLSDALRETPVLRMARPLDEAAERKHDPILDGLLDWASTVVRLPLIPGASQLLAESMHREAGDTSRVEEFPTLFQLFSPHVGKVILEDRQSGRVFRRELSASKEGDFSVVHQNRSDRTNATHRFRVFTVDHEVDDDVRAGAGELHDRAVLEVSWAVPAFRVDETSDAPLWTVPNERGTFWSYFPTKYPTTLSGALNAAWKTNEDRQNLLDSAPLNRELLDVAAQLIIESLPSLVVPSDPAAFLTLLPGRPKESPNWACRYLTERVWELAATSPVLPDQAGTLRPLSHLLIRPSGVSIETLRMWSTYPGRPTNWIHHSVDAVRDRRGKLNHILEAAATRSPESPRVWLEALVEDGSAEASKAALRILHRLLTKDFGADDLTARDAQSARILLTSDGEFVAPTTGQIYKKTSNDVLDDDLIYAHELISDDPHMNDICEYFGIRDADAEGRFRSVLDRGFESYQPEHWTRFWELLRSAGGVAQARAIKTQVSDPGRTLWARTKSGTFAPLRSCLLPGPVVPADGSRDARLTIDTDFHSDDIATLQSLGALDRPTIRRSDETEEWFKRYREAIYEDYCESLPGTTRRVQPHTLRLEGADYAGPLHLFRRLSPEGQARFIAATPADGIIANWTRQIGRQAGTRTPVPSPIRWMFVEHGHIHTSLGVRPSKEALSPALGQYSSTLPVATLDQLVAAKLKLRDKVSQVTEAEWKTLLNQLRESEDDGFIGRTYALLIRVAIGILLAEPSMRCRVGQSWELRPDHEIVIATNQLEFDELVRQRLPAILVEDPRDLTEVELMHEEWGLVRFSDAISKELRVAPSGAATPLADALPAFRTRPGMQTIKFVHLQECHSIEVITQTINGEQAKNLSFAAEGSTVYVLAGTDTLAKMAAVDETMQFGLGRQTCERLLEHHSELAKSRELQERLAKVRRTLSVPQKLALLFTEDALRGGLPPGLISSETRATDGSISHERIAELAYNAYDDGVLRHYRNDLSPELGDVPSRFDGGYKARKFVADLGFPDSFAGASAPAPPQREEAHGPVAFPALHEYQEEIAQRFVEFLTEDTSGRAMLSLPTGAGKTRVAAEGVIRWVRKFGVPTGPVLWIAQTVELCEQAVQSWRFVWEHVGPASSLVLDRLWTGNSATPVTGRPQLVVATDAQLDVCLATDDYAWLRDASLVIVDEAHVATSPEYTKIFELLGLTRSRTERKLIGLTATPFRNSAQLTSRLAGRFGNRRLDSGVLGADPVARLQQLGVLSNVTHLELDGARIELTDTELSTAAKMNGLLPKSAEGRLADNDDRNSEILRAIESLPSDWPVLVFATSRDHAKTLAAKLSDRGIRSVAIDSYTPPAERRRNIENFRGGKIRVITNYGVLSQGFDAPATRAVVIARPVYSANIYQQMIGRGLRGKANGGKDECLILDVKDNIANFENRLAFNEFEYLWADSSRNSEVV